MKKGDIMLDTNYIDIGYDTCKYTVDGITTTAIIKEVTDGYLSVKPISKTNHKDIYETNLDTTFVGETFSSECYEHINLEIWMDGRGCDNSAIGVSGCYEPYTMLMTEVA
tara:strand:- start:41 stop:370 length:330 start_codon:yes stop_codon:yes gene_type:complete